MTSYKNDVLEEPPKRIPGPGKDFAIKGMLVPTSADGSVRLVSIVGSAFGYMLVFSNMELLRKTMGGAGLAFDKVMEVGDPELFLRECEDRCKRDPHLRIIVDPWIKENGRIGYYQLDVTVRAEAN